MTKLVITQDDIDNGVMSNPCECPIARAAQREFHGCSVSVAGCIRVHNVKSAITTCYDLTPEASVFIKRFDLGQLVEPFEFELGQPDLGGGGEMLEQDTEPFDD